MKPSQQNKLVTLWDKFTSGSVNRKIFGAVIAVGLGTAFVKLLSVVKELVVAWKFGTSDEVDAFLIALLIPAFITNIIGGSLNAALIPTYIRVREQEGIKEAEKLFAGSVVWTLGLLIITTIIMLATAPIYLPLIAGGFSTEKLSLTYRLIWTLSPIVILGGVITIWGAILNAGERFVLVSLAPMITPSVTILLLFFVSSWGVFNLANGIVLGEFLEIIVLGTMLYRQGMSLIPRWYGFDRNLKEVAGQYAPMIAGAFLMNSSGLVDQSMAAMLPSGSVAALNYGNRIIALPITISTTALSTAVIPYFSKMVAREDWKSVRHTLKRYMVIIWAVTLPLTGLIILLSEPIVRVLLQRGSFSASDTHIVSEIQICFAFQIPFYIANILVVRLISSMRLNHLLLQVSAFNLIINIVTNYIFIQWMGIKGIALSTSCVYVFCFLYLFINAEIQLKEKDKLLKQNLSE
ncbi:MAG: murein biosynthesis integral membrane protein MurJ [Pseudanabaena sp.]|nr:MAG: murein biosynthesis integral membrane protein MurJ [Pseudanabaena sp.]